MTARKLTTLEKVERWNAESDVLQAKTATDLMKKDRGGIRWLVQDFWHVETVGFVSGREKSFKSTITDDLAVSVVTGLDFLGQFPVLSTGPVIVVQNENSTDEIGKRIRGIYYEKCRTAPEWSQYEPWSVTITDKGVVKIKFPKPLHELVGIHQNAAMLTNKEHKQRIEELIKSVKPVLVIFDPLYAMFDGDLKSLEEVRPVLDWMTQLKNKYNTAVILVHHMPKNTKENIKTYGSAALLYWYECSWTCFEVSTGDEERKIVTLEREFRYAGKYPNLKIGIDGIEEGIYRFDVTTASRAESKADKAQKLEQEILSALKNASGRFLSKSNLAKAIDVSRTAGNFNNTVEQLKNAGKVKVIEAGKHAGVMYLEG